jgi:hypothetical protein
MLQFLFHAAMGSTDFSLYPVGHTTQAEVCATTVE